ncbi:hypothetical protein ABZ348_15860 [Streptomyces sp. NPDC005963]|uniref:hypothetical protein n=1 Tax=Streptomyces sp. NPDC005963 TaxID=3156721 RepID=UPI00340D7342
MSTVLLVLIAVLTPLSALSIWAEREIGDPDGYVSAMAPLASDHRVQEAVAARIADEVLADVDAGPFAPAVRALVHDAVLSFAETDAYATAWNTVNRAAHTAVEQALTSDDGDTASIDLGPVIEQVKRQLSADGVPFADQIPVGDIRITVVESKRLGAAREVFDDLQIAGVWLPVGTALLAVAAVLCARRRWRAVALLGFALAVGGALLLLTVRVGRAVALDDLPSDLDRPAASAVLDALTASLRTTSWWLMGVGLVVGVGIWWLGRRRASAVHADETAGPDTPHTPNAPATPDSASPDATASPDSDAPDAPARPERPEG